MGVHRVELEAELADALGRLAPAAAGGEYLVLGTVETKVWRRGLKGGGTPLGEALDHVADFREVLELDVDPGGWRPAE